MKKTLGKADDILDSDGEEVLSFKDVQHKAHELMDTLTKEHPTNATVQYTTQHYIDRLWDSCPRHSYRAIDFEYANRVIATTLITLFSFQKCTYHYNLIKIAEHYLLLMSKNEPNSSGQANAVKIRGNHII